MRKILFISVLIFMMVLSIGAISAHDADDAIAASDDNIALADSEVSSGTVSGDVDIVTENPWSTSGELSYDIPADAKTIKSADVYVNVYGGSAANTRGANANISISTDNGVKNYTESLWIEEGSTDGTVYVVNDHTTKCYSDYMIHYDVTSLLEGLNGSSLKINVDTFKMEGKEFDGRIKLIGFILAYDDGDEDVINYWINDNQIWTNSNTTLSFDTSSLTDVLEVSLTNIALSSSDATYKINGNFLEEQDHKSGNYYQYNKWDITNDFIANQNTEFIAIGTAGSYGVSYKNTLSVLKAKEGVIEATASLVTERANGGFNIIYPGTANQITVTVNSNKNGKYTVQLLANGEIVNSTEISINGESAKVDLIDPTIRPIDESSIYATDKDLTKVDYTVNLIYNDKVITNSSLSTVVLYNGYFAKDLAYPGNDYSTFFEGAVSGDIVFIVSEEAYATGTVNRVDSWNIELPENSSFVKAWVYVPYAYGGADSIDLFDVTFNDVKPAAVSFSRDQANVVSTSGYGLIVYDVTDLIKSGDNVFALNKTHSAGAYPSTLIYLYNTTGSNVVKNVYIANGADMVGTYGNGMGRAVTVDTTLNVDSSNVIDAVAYIFGAGATTGRATVIVNGEENATAWDTDASNAINIYTKDISNSIKDSNEISVVLNNGMFTTLQQIIVTTQKAPTVITAPSVTKVYNVAKNLVVTLKDANGPIKNAKITITLNGKTYQKTTGDDGKVTLAISNLVPKNYYTATVTFAGDETHAKSTVKTKVVVKKAAVKLTAKKKTFKAKVKTKKYTVTLKNNKGKVLKKVKLTLKVKGKTYKATTNSKGKATFKITKLTKKGKYTAKINFKGDKYYNKLTKKVKITIKK